LAAFLALTTAFFLIAYLTSYLAFLETLRAFFVDFLTAILAMAITFLLPVFLAALRAFLTT